MNNGRFDTEQGMIDQARMEMAHKIVSQELEEVYAVSYLEEQEVDGFNPSHIAMDNWGKEV